VHIEEVVELHAAAGDQAAPHGEAAGIRGERASQGDVAIAIDLEDSLLTMTSEEVVVEVVGGGDVAGELAREVSGGEGVGKGEELT
jgi:hypothetical protein